MAVPRKTAEVMLGKGHHTARASSSRWSASETLAESAVVDRGCGTTFLHEGLEAALDLREPACTRRKAKAEARSPPVLFSLRSLAQRECLVDHLVRGGELTYEQAHGGLEHGCTHSWAGSMHLLREGAACASSRPGGGYFAQVQEGDKPKAAAFDLALLRPTALGELDGSVATARRSS